MANVECGGTCIYKEELERHSHDISFHNHLIHCQSLISFLEKLPTSITIMKTSTIQLFAFASVLSVAFAAPVPGTTCCN